jgi:hypothetical protein
MCEDVISDLTELEPNKYLQSLYDDLDALGMLRPGDEANFQGIDNYFTERLANLPLELEQYRLGNVCEYPNVECNGQCVQEWECQNPCVPGKPLPGGVAEPAVDEIGAGGGGAGGGGPIDCPPILEYRP